MIYEVLGWGHLISYRSGKRISFNEGIFFKGVCLLYILQKMSEKSNTHPHTPMLSHAKFCRIFFITARKRSCGKVMFLHLSLSHSVFTGGVCLSACWDTPLSGSHTPRGDVPLGRHAPPPSRRLLLRTVRILRECILVETYFHLKKDLYCISIVCKSSVLHFRIL